MTVSIPMAGMNGSGGVKTLVMLANAMAGRGWSVRLVLPDYASEGPFATAAGVERLVLRTFGRGPLRLLSYYARLSYRASTGADLCIASFYLTAYCAVLSTVVSRAKTVYFVQGYEAESHGRFADTSAPSRWLRETLARLSYRLPVPLICVSRWLRDRIGRTDAVVVSQGLDLAVFKPALDHHSDAADLVVGTIGSHAPTKGYADFCRAFARLPGPVRRRARLLVAAAGDVELPAGARGRRVEATTEAEMAAFYNRCDIFVFASRVEGFGLPPLEAMACGCAVITTDCGGVRDYVAADANAVLVPVADAGALALALERLIEDGAARARLAAAGTVTARRRGRDEMVAEFLSAVTAERA
jgi:glycosyltransferase involved in cell wall biosynthesis